MTIIDTTLYCNGELRLARHGAGRGGNVLTHVPSGDQVEITDSLVEILVKSIGVAGVEPKEKKGLLYHVLPGTTPRANFDAIAWAVRGY